MARNTPGGAPCIAWRTKFMAGMVAMAGLAGCAGNAQPRITSEAGPGDTVPVAVAVEYVEYSRSGPQRNRLGGEIPKSVPVAPVSEGELDDLSNG